MQIQPLPKLMQPTLLRELPEYVAPPPPPPAFKAPKDWISGKQEDVRFKPLMAERKKLTGDYRLDNSNEVLGLNVNAGNVDKLKRWLELGGAPNRVYRPYVTSDSPDHGKPIQYTEKWENSSKRNTDNMDLISSKIKAWEARQEAAKATYRAKMMEEFNHLKSGLTSTTERDIVLTKRRGSRTLNTSGSQGGLNVPQ